MRMFARTSLVLSLAVVGLSTPSDAKVEIEGADSTLLQVRASGDAISDVLTAISKVANVRYRAAIPLGTTITGTYSGSAEAVIARLLSDYSFAMRHTGEVLEVSIYGRWLSNPSTQHSPSTPTSTPTLLATPAPDHAAMPNPRDDSRYKGYRPVPPLAAARHGG